MTNQSSVISMNEKSVIEIQFCMFCVSGYSSALKKLKMKNVIPSKKVINKKREVKQCANCTLYLLYERFLHIQKKKKNDNEKQNNKADNQSLIF